MNMKNRSLNLRILLILFIVGLIVISCKKEKKEYPAASKIELLSGNNQTILMGNELASPIFIKVTDQYGNPFRGTTVSFIVAVGSTSFSSDVSDENGLVSVKWTVGSSSSDQTLTAIAFEDDGITPLKGSPITVNASSLIPTKLELVYGNNQNGILGDTLKESIIIRVLNQNGTAIAGHFVHFSVNDNGEIYPEGLSNYLGKISNSWRLGTNSFMQRLTISSFRTDGTTHLEGSPLIIEPKIASTLEIISGNNQTGEILSRLSEPIVARVKDQAGNLIAGIPVAFEEPLDIGGGLYVPFFTVYDTSDAEGLVEHKWKLLNHSSLSSQRVLNIMIVNSDSIIAPNTQLIKANATATALLTTTVTDIDGNVYGVLPYGDNLWMTSNLKTTKYNDGSEINNITGTLDWYNAKSGAFCWFNNDVMNKEKYGALYNWYAVQTEKLCPQGWRTPTENDWNSLINYLTENGFGFGGSGSDVAKSMATKTDWTYISALIINPGEIVYDMQDNNSSGFSAYPAGFRMLGGFDDNPTYVLTRDFMLKGSHSIFWTSTAYTLYGQTRAINFSLSSYGAVVTKSSSNFYSGSSVRCVRE